MKMDMTVGKEWKKILLFTLPIIAGNLLQQMYNFIDSILVGRFVSSTALAAVGTSMPLTFLFFAMAMGISVGVGVVVAQYFGAKKYDKLSPAIDTSLILLGACGLTLTIVGWFAAPFMLENLLSVRGPALPLAIQYFRIFSLGFFFQFTYNGIAAVLRGVGDSKATLYFLLISTILSTILTVLFVAVLQWGVVGAASSTVIAQAVCSIVSYIYLRKRFPYDKSAVHFDREIAATMIKLGLPVAIQLVLVSFGNVLMQRLVNGFEADLPGFMAAFTAATRLDMFIFVPIMGFQSGLASFSGQNIGANKLDRVKRGFHVTLVMSVAFTVVLSVLFFLFAAQFLSFFGLESSELQPGVEMVRFLSMFFWLFSSYMSLGGLLQGAGDTIMQSAATLMALVVRVMTAYVFVHFGWLGYSAAWTTNPIGWAAAAIIVYIRYFTGGWKKRSIAARPGPPADSQNAER